MTHAAPATGVLTRETGEPLACYARWRAALRGDEGLLLVDFKLDPYWDESARPLALTAIYCLRRGVLSVAVTDQPLTPDGPLPVLEQYRRWVVRHRLFDVDPNLPLQLQPELIAKPWGREIWYTAAERRGICHFASGAARVPIPWLQPVLPAEAVGLPGEPLLLLKILEPRAEHVLGDLYFELHETKRELYVVTHIDRQAWPDGVGYVRYGFDPQEIAHYPDHEQFRLDYLAAVTAYEAERRSIDALAGQGLAADAARRDREMQLRERMDRFTALRPLRVGDVVQIPLLLPHALQHGVRVVEFQTASYERKILSFAQQVLTQDHWDTAAAVARMRLLPPDDVPGEAFSIAEGVSAEQIADFPDFEVQRLTIQPGSGWRPDACSSYRILMVLGGSLEVAGASCGADQAMLLPRDWRGLLAAPQGAPPLVFLLARPRC